MTDSSGLTPKQIRRLDQICDHFEAKFKAGHEPKIEEYLYGVEGELQEALLTELLHLEIAYRQGRKDSVEIGDYRDRFPKHVTLVELVLNAALVSPQADTPEDSPGKRYLPQDFPVNFNDYLLVSEISRGGMGVVYKATQRSVNRTVALKMIRTGELASPQEIKRFHIEAEAAANLDHPNIVPLYEVGQHEGQHYYTMGYVEGQSLAELLRDRLLAPRTAAKYLQTVARAMHYAHERGVLHRDIKPSNVLLDNSGQIRITDFGLAKRIGNESALTRDSQVLGTPEYMPPEQARGNNNQLGPEADIYSLGALLYALLTGRPPFRAENWVATLHQVCEKEPVAPRQLNPDLDCDLDTICLKCLEKEPDRRYRSAQDLADELERYLRGEPIVSRPISLPERSWRWCKRNPVLASMGTTVFVALLIGTIVSSCFALVATKEARRANIAESIASSEKVRADKKAEEARQKATEVLASRDEIQKQLLRARKGIYASKIGIAQRDIEDGNYWQAESILSDLEQDLHGWEYWYLRSLIKARTTTLAKLSDTVKSIAFSPDGQQIVSGCGDNTVRIWDTSSGEEILALKGHTMAVQNAVFSPDGQRIISGSYDGMVKIWNANSGEEIFTLKGHKDPGQWVTFSPDGHRVASVSWGRTAQFWNGLSVKIWDANTGKEFFRLHGHTDCVDCIAFSPDGRRIVSGSRDKTVRVWDANSGEEMIVFKRHTNSVASVVFCPDGQRVISGDHAGKVKVWDANSGKEKFTLDVSRHNVRSVDISPDGRRILVGDALGSLTIWDANSGEEISRFQGHYSFACVAWDPRGERFASGSWDGTVRIWNASDSIEPMTLKGHSQAALSAAFSPDGHKIVSGSDDYTARIWDANSGEETSIFKGHASTVESVAFCPDGQRIISGGGDDKLRIWNASTGEEVLVLKGHAGRITSLAVSSDGKRIVSGSWDKTIRVWDINSGEEILALKGHTDPVDSVAFSPDNKRIVSGSKDKTVRVWDANSGEEILMLEGHTTYVYSVAFSPDGLRVVSGSDTVKVWDVNSGEVEITLHGHMGDVLSVAYSPDGRRIVSGDSRGSIKIWDPDSGHETLTLHTSHPVKNVSFSPDGLRILTASWDGKLKIWDASDSAEVSPHSTTEESRRQ